MSDHHSEVYEARGSDIINHEGDQDSPLRVITYDFKRPDKFSKEQLRTINYNHETFCRLSTASMSAQLRYPVDLRVASVDQLTFGEFIRSIPNPTTLGTVQMRPLKGAAVLEIDPAITFAIIERLFGGDAGGTVLPREYTEIELSMMRGMIERMLGNLGEAWKAVVDLQPELGNMETNPQFMQMVPPNEMVVLVTIEAKVGESQGMINLCLPYVTIEPIVGMLSAVYFYTSVRRKPGSRETPLGYGTNIPLHAELCIDGGTISLHDLSKLECGTMLPLEAWDEGRAYLRAGDVRMPCVITSRSRGGEATFTLPSPPLTAGERALFAGIPGGDPAEAGHSAERAEEAILTVKEELEKGLNRLMNRVEELSYRQDEVADRVMLTGESSMEPSAHGEHTQIGGSQDPFGFLRPTDGEFLSMFLQAEHPQLIALVLSSIEPALASAVLQALDPEQQVDVTERIYRIARVAPQVIARICAILERKFTTITETDPVITGGYTKAVEILNLVSRSAERHIIESLEKRLPEVAEDIKRHMFVFEDISLLDPSAVAAIVEHVSRDDLLISLKGVPQEVYDHVVSHSSDEAKAYIESELRNQPPVRLSEQEAAQQRIVNVIRALEEEGLIRVDRPGEDELVE